MMGGASLLCLGLWLGQLPLMEVIDLAFVLGYLALFLIVGLIVAAVFNKEELAQGIGLGLLGLFFLGSSATLTYISQIALRKHYAQKLVEDLKAYRYAQNHLPAELGQIGTKQGRERFFYRPDSTLRHFQLGYSLDGWHRAEYSSQTDTWVYGD